MARSSWSYLKGEKRTGEYEELTVRSIGHWWIKDDATWPEALRAGYHLASETGVAMIEPTALVTSDPAAYRDRLKLTYRSYVLQQDSEEKSSMPSSKGRKNVERSLMFAFHFRSRANTFPRCVITSGAPE